MNPLNSVRVRYEGLRSLGSPSISTTYVAVGNPFSNPIRILKVTNTTDVNVIISFNGIDDDDVVIASSFYLYDFGANRSDRGNSLEQPAGERIYVKRESATAPTTGRLYVTAIYAADV